MTQPSHNHDPRDDVIPLSRATRAPVTREQLTDTEITIAVLFDAIGVLQHLLALDHAPGPDQPLDLLERRDLDALLVVCTEATNTIVAVVDQIAPAHARGLHLAALLRHDVVHFTRDAEPPA